MPLGTAQAQTGDSTSVHVPTFHIQPTVGYNGFSLGDVADFHQAVVSSYNEVGIAVPTQRSFPGSPVYGVDVLCELSPGKRFGLGLRYTSTRAYSLYGDYAGTLDIVSTVSALTVETVSVVELSKAGSVRPVLGFRGGTVIGNVKTEEDLDLGEVGSLYSELRGTGVGFSVEVFGGALFDAGPVTLGTHVGYRYGRVSRLNGSVRLGESEFGESESEKGALPFRLGLSGFVTTVSASIMVL